MEIFNSKENVRIDTQASYIFAGIVESVKDIKNKKWINILSKLDSSDIIRDINWLNKWIQMMQPYKIDDDLKYAIKIGIWANILKWKKLSDMGELIKFFPNMKEDDFILSTASLILSETSNIQKANYEKYKADMQRLWLWSSDNTLIIGLQKYLWLSNIDGKLWKQTLSQLYMKVSGKSSLEEWNNYKKDWDIFKEYILNHVKDPWLSLCSGFVMNALEDIVNQQWKVLHQKSVDAWELYNSLDNNYFNKEKISTLDNIETQDKIIKQPKWTLLTVRFENTTSRNDAPWVSHVMISMGNGIYMDYIHKKARTINMNKAKFWNKASTLPIGNQNTKTQNLNYFTVEWSNYLITDDASIISPNINKMPAANKKTNTYKNVVPITLSRKLANENKIPWEFVYAQMMKENNFTTKDLNSPQKIINISLPFTQVKEFDYTILDPDISDLDVAKNFLQTLKDKKWELMQSVNFDNERYDKIAMIAFGILWNETDYGRSKKYTLKKYGWDIYQDSGQIVRKVLRDIKKGDFRESYEDTEYNSKGLTQIKYNLIIKNNPKLKELYTKYKITETNLDDPKFCAIATFLFLADAYQTLETYKIGNTNYNKKMTEYNNNKNKKKPLPINDWNIFSYLPYLFNKPSEIYNGTATPDTNNYISALNKKIETVAVYTT